jgi:ABC-2 type transport system permease protein
MNLGYDRYTKETYGNKDFMLNAVNYLCDDAGLLNIRSRELKIRLLSKTRIAEERTMWQVINILGPIVMLIVFGIVLSYVRKRKNRKN